MKDWIISVITETTKRTNLLYLLQCSLGTLDGDLIIGGIPVEHPEIKVLHIQLQVREDKLHAAPFTVSITEQIKLVLITTPEVI
jgi:hypothetical protein